jgi:hypothetical protein
MIRGAPQCTGHDIALALRLPIPRPRTHASTFPSLSHGASAGEPEAHVKAPTWFQHVSQTRHFDPSKHAHIHPPWRAACPRSSRRAAVLDSRINTTRGTQDVNDPERPTGRVAGPDTGSFTSWVPFDAVRNRDQGRHRTPPPSGARRANASPCRRKALSSTHSADDRDRDVSFKPVRPG